LEPTAPPLPVIQNDQQKKIIIIMRMSLEAMKASRGNL